MQRYDLVMIAAMKQPAPRARDSGGAGVQQRDRIS
jgi:hypothetical protein